MFLAPELYAVHAVLTGLSLALMHALGVRLGFTFSAGAFDYALSYGLSSRGWMLLPVGALTFAVYYGIFSVCIRRFRLATPGREPRDARGSSSAAPIPATAEAYVKALGGAANLRTVDACTTRLRLEVADNAAVDEPALRALGAKAVVRPAPGSVQVVLGPEADRVASSIRAALPSLASPAPVHPQAHAPADARAHPGTDAGAWLSAFGGRGNVLAVEGVAGTRLRVELVDASRIDEPRLRELGAPAVMRVSSSVVHVVVGAGARALAASLGQGV
jgi:PTS system N-acetylglucosamine-specific IIC component